MSIVWTHPTQDDSHPADAHYAGTGSWVCFKCREPLTDVGRKVNMTALREVKVPDPERPGLDTEGS